MNKLFNLLKKKWLNSLILIIIIVVSFTIIGNQFGVFPIKDIVKLTAYFFQGLIRPLPPAAGNCQLQSGQNNYYVDINSTCGQCNDARLKSENTVTMPWCTVAKAAAADVVTPGDTIYIQEGRYGQDFNFVISGTETAPITYKGFGKVVIGTFDDVTDENFQLTPDLTNVYEMSYPRLKGYNDVGYQTYFNPILIDDDGVTNPAKFTVLEQDGPITLAYVTSVTEVQRVEGSWYIENGKLYVHPYGNRIPSTTATDIVIGTTEGLRHDVTANYNNFYDVGFNYNAMEEMRVTGQYNRFVNNFGLRGIGGSHNYVENATAANLFYRLPAGDYSWIEKAEGWGFGVSGSFNTVKNAHVYHNFNNFIATGDNQTISNVIVHGAPNHGFETSKLTNSKLMNIVGYGNQDIFYIRGGLQNIVYEGFTAQDGITFEEQRNGKSSGLTFRNNIFGSCWIGEGGYGVESCEYEPTVTVENSIFMCNPGEQLRIQHCVNADMSTDPIYSLADYLAGCQSGAITNCMTLRDIQVVNSDYENVISGGRAPYEIDAWDVHIPWPFSPAFNTGSLNSLAVDDFEGDARPLEGGYDIGADELLLGGGVVVEPIFIDDYLVPPSQNPNINPSTVLNIGWDGASSYYPLSGAINPGPTVTGLWHSDDDTNDGMATDSSGNANTGTCTSPSCPTLTTPGKYSGAYHYDGIDDGIVIPSSSSLNELSNVTVSLWAKIEDIGQINQALFSFYANADDRAYLWFHDSTPSRGLRVYNDIDNAEVAEITTGWTPVLNEWFHVAWVMDGTQWILYINGVPYSSPETKTLAQLDDGFVTNIGKRAGQNDRPWKGTIDEVVVYNKALASSEIQALYTGGPPSGSFESTIIPTTDFNRMNVRWSESGSSVRMFVSTTGGDRWCPVLNGQTLKPSANCPMRPANNFKYKVNMNAPTNLNSATFTWAYMPPPPKTRPMIGE